ncbi:hypothetical protein QR685DRAFT_524162, partial [Neurospora intermedia]
MIAVTMQEYSCGAPNSVARKTPAQSFIGYYWRHSTTPRWRFDAVTLENLPDVMDEDREEKEMIRFVSLGGCGWEKQGKETHMRRASDSSYIDRRRSRDVNDHRY